MVTRASRPQSGTRIPRVGYGNPAPGTGIRLGRTWPV